MISLNMLILVNINFDLMLESNENDLTKTNVNKNIFLEQHLLHETVKIG